MPDPDISLNMDPEDILENRGATVPSDPPLTISGLLTDYASQPQPPGNSLELLMDNQQMRDAGIPATVTNGADLGKPVDPIADSKDSAIPVAPPGVSVDDNMRRAREMQDTIMKGMSGDMPPADPAYGIMTAWFPTGHEMDYKKDGQQYRDFGNFNYGAVGSALGIGPYMLHGAAGVQQIKDKTWTPRDDGYPFLTKTFGDSQRDWDQIDKGIAYEKEHRTK
jgi:hypothetical protein